MFPILRIQLPMPSISHLPFVSLSKVLLDVRHCGVKYSVGKGALLVAQSGDITSCEDFSGKSIHREFHCAPRALETIAEEIGHRFTGDRIFHSPFVCDESLCLPFLRFHTEMDSKPTAIESSSLLREFVGEMILRYGNRSAAILKLGNERWAVKRVKDYLESRYAENVTLEELARIANLSPFHLIRVFRKEVRTSASCIPDSRPIESRQGLARPGRHDWRGSSERWLLRSEPFYQSFPESFWLPARCPLEGVGSLRRRELLP